MTDPPSMVMHVEKIEELVDQGQAEEAFEALDQLLSLGPSNTAALKLKARILESQGKFEDELKVWSRIIEIDSEDMDAATFFQLHHLEEREHFYFTDQLPDGGNRYIAYPRTLLKAFVIGLAGSGLFLVLTNIGQVHLPILMSVPSILSLFLLSVVAPWGYIISVYLRMMRYIVMDESGFEVVSRLNTTRYTWDEIEKIYISYDLEAADQPLHLMVEPKSGDQPVIQIDIGRDTSSIRARSFFLRDMATRFVSPSYIDAHDVKESKERKTLNY